MQKTCNIIYGIYYENRTQGTLKISMKQVTKEPRLQLITNRKLVAHLPSITGTEINDLGDTEWSLCTVKCKVNHRPPYTPKPLTYQHQNRQTWIVIMSAISPSKCKIWLESVHRELPYNIVYVKYNDFVRFSFPFLSFFILVIAYSRNGWTDFNARWLIWRGFAQGSAFWG